MLKPSGQNVVEGKLHEVKGKVKEQLGRVTNDPNMESDGTVEKIGGIVQNKVGHVQQVIQKP
jgi:uncharacterized protein YjbJ (UPF0337 family)